MICRNCGGQISDQANVCNFCGAPVRTDAVDSGEPFVVIPDDAGSKNSGRKKKTRKLVLIISLILIIAMIAAIVVIVAVKSPLTAEKANKEYLTVLDENYNDIVRFEKSSGVNGVAFFDINGSGIDDMVFVTRDSVEKGGFTRLNIAFDAEGGIITDSVAVGDVFELFVGKKSGVFRLFTRDTTPRYGKHIYVESLFDLFLKDKKIDLLNKKGRYHNDETDTQSFTAPADGGDDYSANAGSFNGGDAEGNTILIDSICPVNGVPVPGEAGNNSISTGVDHARSGLGGGGSTSGTESSSGTAEDSSADPSTEPEPTEAPEPTQLVLSDVDPDSMPTELVRFLNEFKNYHSEDNTENHREYDVQKPALCYNTLVRCIANFYTCVNIADYPEISYTGGVGSPDPQNRFESGHALWKEDDVIWVMKNIFHIADEDIRPMIDAALAADSEYLYEYESGGVTYLCSAYLVKGNSLPTYAVFDTVKTDGEKYYIVYHLHMDRYGTTRDFEPYYAEVSEVEIGGVKYWTMYKNSETIPELTSSGTDGDALTQFAGSYLFSSGAGGWSTQMELKADGTVTGEFHASEKALGSKEYDSIAYEAVFSGRCTDLQKVNDYTYTFTITDIVYQNQPGTEEITTQDGKNVKKVYSAARGLLEGVNTVYAFTPDAPVSELAQSFVSDINNMRWSEKNESSLLYYCLYLAEYGSAWLGPKG